MAEESKIEEFFCSEIRELGGFAKKLGALDRKGDPDRVIFLPGALTLFVEFKAEGKKPDPLQTVRANFFRSLGYRVYVIDDKLSAIKLLNLISDALHTLPTPGTCKKTYTFY